MKKPSSIARLRGLILVICDRLKDDPNLTVGKVELLCYAIDFSAYGKTGKAITDQPYIKRRRGPSPRDFWRAIRQLEASGAIELGDVVAQA